MELRIGSVVRTKAGHDKNKLMAVTGTEERYVLLCDGKERKLEKPKRKNVLHIAATNTVLENSAMETNRSLKKALAQIDSEAQMNSGR